MEGASSPVQVTGTNVLLRGLSLGVNYFVAVSAVDTSGNESPLSQAIEVTTKIAAPSPPTSVAARFGSNGTNIVMWGLSEDDGYNDRDVVQYDISRAILPGGTYVLVGHVSSGVGIYMEPTVKVLSGKQISYEVSAVSSNDASSTETIAAVADMTPPKLTISAPRSGQQLSNTVIVASGTASDNIAIGNVLYQLNSNGWNLATLNNNGSNWTANLSSMVPGSNELFAYSMDTSGNVSTTNVVKFVYVVTSSLTLITNGSGKINRSFAGNILKVGSSNTLTAVPGGGEVFSNWSGTISSFANPLKFVMQSNMVLQANFISNPFVGPHGIYNGLFSVASEATEATAGMLSDLDVTASGAYTGKLLTSGSTFAISGGFNVSGQATNHISRTTKLGGPLTLEMTLHWNDSPPNITGNVSGTNGGLWLANLTNELAAKSSSSAEYTMLMPPPTNENESYPPGFGYILMTNRAGAVTLSVNLADGNSFSQAVPVSSTGDLPVYGTLYSGTGLLLGWISLESGSLAGNLTWIKPTSHATAIYTNGFTNTVVVQGSLWTNPLPHTAPIDLPSGQLDIFGESLLTNLTFNVSVSNNNALVKLPGNATNSLTGSINPKTGLLTITFGNGVGKTTTEAKGAVLQNVTNAAGFFLGKTNAGSILLQP